jgi:phosphoglycolate phosphatase
VTEPARHRAPPRPRALVDNWGTIHEALNATLAAMGHPTWSLEQTRRRVRQSLRDSFPRMFAERWRDAERIFYERFAESHLHALRALPGAAEMLRTLSRAGLYLGVVSNKNGGFLRREADHLGWTGYFGGLVGAADAAADKPAAAPVELALAGSGVPPGPEVWFVGDTEIDVECAHNAGCTAVLLHCEPTGRAPGDGTRAAIRMGGCVDLRRYVAGLVNEL